MGQRKPPSTHGTLSGCLEGGWWVVGRERERERGSSGSTENVEWGGFLSWLG